MYKNYDQHAHRFLGHGPVLGVSKAPSLICGVSYRNGFASIYFLFFKPSMDRFGEGIVSRYWGRPAREANKQGSPPLIVHLVDRRAKLGETRTACIRVSPSLPSFIAIYDYLANQLGQVSES